MEPKIETRARQTGRKVLVFDTRASDNIFDPDGGRWVVFCADHATLVNTATQRMARAIMAQPIEFCSCCQGTCRTRWDAGMPACPSCGMEVK